MSLFPVFWSYRMMCPPARTFLSDIIDAWHLFRYCPNNRDWMDDFQTESKEESSILNLGTKITKNCNWAFYQQTKGWHRRSEPVLKLFIEDQWQRVMMGDIAPLGDGWGMS